MAEMFWGGDGRLLTRAALFWKAILLREATGGQVGDRLEPALQRRWGAEPFSVFMSHTTESNDC